MDTKEPNFPPETADEYVNQAEQDLKELGKWPSLVEYQDTMREWLRNQFDEYQKRLH